MFDELPWQIERALGRLRLPCASNTGLASIANVDSTLFTFG
jgi:hypothetical protein